MQFRGASASICATSRRLHTKALGSVNQAGAQPLARPTVGEAIAAQKQWRRQEAEPLHHSTRSSEYPAGCFSAGNAKSVHVPASVENIEGRKYDDRSQI